MSLSVPLYPVYLPLSYHALRLRWKSRFELEEKLIELGILSKLTFVSLLFHGEHVQILCMNKMCWYFPLRTENSSRIWLSKFEFLFLPWIQLKMFRYIPKENGSTNMFLKSMCLTILCHKIGLNPNHYLYLFSRYVFSWFNDCVGLLYLLLLFRYL